MLETNEVDVDLFTPAPGTSLATIFSNTQADENVENASLKYIPQVPVPPIQSTTTTLETINTTQTPQCIFATSVTAYEWLDNKYNHRENLGLALIKAAKDDIHQLIIYTSEKNTLSLATISSTFVVNLKKDVSISYYDNFKKYWLICASGSKITNLVDHLKNLKVNFKISTDNDISCEKETNISTLILKENLGSDTDSSVNKKLNKDSILRRMATMGQSVLPSNKNVTMQSTDSSDTNDYDHAPVLRHKPKNLPKRYAIERSVSTNVHQEANKIVSNIIDEGENSAICLPIKLDASNTKKIDNMNHVIIKESNTNDISIFISEQRISNSELRININRLSDKIDKLYDKTSFRGLETYQCNQQNEIVNKLLNEYETKILTYEKFIKSKGFDCNLLFAKDIKDESLVSETGNVNNIEICYESRNDTEMLKKMEELRETISQTEEKYKKYEETLLKEIINLQKDLCNKNEILSNINENVQTLTNYSDRDDYTNKLKSIMNNTFQTISTQFNDEDTYSGTLIKNTVAKVIKKITIEALNDEK